MTIFLFVCVLLFFSKKRTFRNPILKNVLFKIVKDPDEMHFISENKFMLIHRNISLYIHSTKITLNYMLVAVVFISWLFLYKQLWSQILWTWIICFDSAVLNLWSMIESHESLYIFFNFSTKENNFIFPGKMVFGVVFL